MPSLRFCALLGAAVALVSTVGCIKNQDVVLATRLSPAPVGVALRPPPPDDVYWLRLKSAKVPVRTQGGQLWDDLGAFPDPYVRVTLGGEVLFESEAVQDTLTPTWTAPGRNFELGSSDKLVVELRDADAINDRIMGRATVGVPGAVDLEAGVMEIDTGNRSSVVMEVALAHALIGLGFDYDVYDGRATVTEVWKYSPAGRGGMEVGDQLVTIGEREVKTSSAREIRSAINAISGTPVTVIVQHRSGTTSNVSLSAGPIYPLADEYGPLE